MGPGPQQMPPMGPGGPGYPPHGPPMGGPPPPHPNTGPPGPPPQGGFMDDLGGDMSMDMGPGGPGGLMSPQYNANFPPQGGFFEGGM